MKSPISVSIQELSKSKKALETYGKVVPDADKIFWGTVDQYLPLVKGMVGRMRIYFSDTTDIKDIYSIGLQGLISAVQHYDPGKGRAFGAYAKLRVRGALLDELRRMDPLTRDERLLVKNFNRALGELEQKLQREVTDEDICKELEITPRECARLRWLHKPTHVPLDAPYSGDHGDGFAIHELISDPTEQDGRDLAQKHELIELIKVGLHEMKDMDQRVLALYYIEGLKLAEIAEIMELSESRICQIHAKAIVILRKLILSKLKH